MKFRNCTINEKGLQRTMVSLKLVQFKIYDALYSLSMSAFIIQKNIYKENLMMDNITV